MIGSVLSKGDVDLDGNDDLIVAAPYSPMDVKNNSKAFKSGLREGMIIVRVGQSEVSDLNVITNAIEKAKKQKRNALLMLVNFEGTDRFVAVEIF